LPNLPPTTAPAAEANFCRACPLQQPLPRVARLLARKPGGTVGFSHPGPYVGPGCFFIPNGDAAPAQATLRGQAAALPAGGLSAQLIFVCFFLFFTLHFISHIDIRSSIL